MISVQIGIDSEDILIVDDTPENLRLLSTMLTKQGYHVRKALSGPMALTAVQAAQPRLILLDIMMPHVNGYEVCQQLKADPKTAEIPVIFLSALNETFDKVKAFEVGGADYITKPFQFEEVLARVRNQLALRAATLQNQLLNAQLEARVRERTHQLEKVNQDLQREINQRQILQEQLLKMALHDALTGLPNRVLLMQRLEEALARMKAEQGFQFAVLFLDCDRFKVVNDSLGHLVGDEILMALARRLERVLTPEHLIARLGGDEFAILLNDITGLIDATQVASHILQELTRPFELPQREIFLNASIGITLANPSYDKPEHILRDADTAMYRAKLLGKGQYHVFDPTLHDAALKVLQLETDLRRSLERQELCLHYQPIISLKTGKVVGFEALVRWLHPQQGLISPMAFIPIAEETGFIREIDLWGLQEACQQLKRWQAQLAQHQYEYLRCDPQQLTVSVNLSARLFADANLIWEIDRVLDATQVHPRNLKLEITESAIMNHPQAAKEIMEKLRDRQIQLCIDDFGTGYSSLSYLHHFPVDTLKIDRSFVSRLTSSPHNLGLVPTIIKIAQTMNLRAIAEGIETAEQLLQLQQLNCELGQGYFFSRPLESQQATIFLTTSTL
ncbi:MAG: EAL domain-containing protein [Desertifilum sp. SIO1I2]|nr:EAL domain-containing protein [Desertifilum sp. SIO1I2]